MIRLKQKLAYPSLTQSGFTLIECLLAIIIVSLLLVAVSPAIVLSVATRVQARRVELATQAAASYIDAVRVGTLPPPPAPNNTVLLPLPLAQPNQPPQPQTAFPQGAVPAPTGTAGWTCHPTYPPAQPVYCLDGSGTTYLVLADLDSKRGQSKGDFIVQPFRSAIDASEDGSRGYLLGVRVYRADAFDGSVTLKTTAENDGRRAATYTMGGIGDRSVPVIEMTTAIRPAPAGGASNYNSLKERLGVKSSPNPSPTISP